MNYQEKPFGEENKSCKPMHANGHYIELEEAAGSA